MTIEKALDGSSLTLTVEGRVDTMTAPELEKEITESIPGMTALILDFAGVSYISSAGLRVLLMSEKQMKKQAGSFVLRHANTTVREVLDMTGFSDIITIED